MDEEQVKKIAEKIINSTNIKMLQQVSELMMAIKNLPSEEEKIIMGTAIISFLLNCYDNNVTSLGVLEFGKNTRLQSNQLVAVLKLNQKDNEALKKMVG